MMKREKEDFTSSESKRRKEQQTNETDEEQEVHLASQRKGMNILKENLTDVQQEKITEDDQDLLTMECLPCKKKFTESENYDKHLQSQEHKQKMLCVQERQNDLPDESEAVSSSNSNYVGTIKCQVCDLSFNSFESFQNHTVTPEHALKIMLKNIPSSGSSNLNTTNINHEFNSMKYKMETTDEDTILPELNKTSDFSYGKCEVCVKSFSGPEPYKQHLDSQGHKKKVALKQNSGGNNPFKCEPCNKSFSGEVPFTQHMISEIHRKKLKQIEVLENFKKVHSPDSAMGIKENTVEKEDLNRLFFCKICNKECSGFIPYQEHLAGSTHSKNEKRAQTLTSTMESMRLQSRKVSEESANLTTTMNSSCEIDNGKQNNGSVFAKQLDKIDDLDKSEELPNEMLALIKQDENKNNEISSPIKKVDKNAFNGSLEKTEEENE